MTLKKEMADKTLLRACLRQSLETFMKYCPVGGTETSNRGGTAQVEKFTQL